MKTYPDFRLEIEAGKIKNYYLISASDSYFLSEAGSLLREKLSGSPDNTDNFYLKYADETPLTDVIDLISGSASLFSSGKILILKRCEKYSRKLKEFLELIKKTDKDTHALFVFDRDFVAEKKLDVSEFYNFSELSQRALIEWIKSEFELNGLKINIDAVESFLTIVPLSFDLMSSEINKISNYDFGSAEKTVTREIIMEFTGYDPEFSPDELIYSIIHKNHEKALKILDNLLNSKGMNEVYLLSILSGYYLDIMSFKTSGIEKLDSKTLYAKYKLWGERVRFAKSNHNFININSIEVSLEKILDTDKKLKSTMLNSKVLLTSLVEELINA